MGWNIKSLLNIEPGRHSMIFLSILFFASFQLFIFFSYPPTTFILITSGFHALNPPKWQCLKVTHHLLSNIMELGLWIPIRGLYLILIRTGPVNNPPKCHWKSSLIIILSHSLNQQIITMVFLEKLFASPGSA